MQTIAKFVLVNLVLIGSTTAASAQPAPAVLAAAACPANLQFSFERLQDEKPQSLCQYAGKVVLVVNTASFCGFTGQYKGLETVYERYKDKGLVVLGFPSNDFAQEPEDNKKIADFCESTFGVKFPMFVKTSVRGAQATPFFKQLAAQAGSAPSWNFHKYLLGRDGKVVTTFGSRTDALDAKVLAALEKQLATP